MAPEDKPLSELELLLMLVELGDTVLRDDDSLVVVGSGVVEVVDDPPSQLTGSGTLGLSQYCFG